MVNFVHNFLYIYILDPNWPTLPPLTIPDDWFPTTASPSEDPTWITDSSTTSTSTTTTTTTTQSTTTSTSTSTTSTTTTVIEMENKIIQNKREKNERKCLSKLCHKYLTK